ncbi:MAG: hypothetical protein ACRCTI_02535 [Beijerinckiaceae bacterium]
MSAALNATPATGYPTALAAAANMITLRRTGERPLVFQGSEVCSAMSYMPGTPLWYEINVYRTAAEGYIANVRMFTKSDNDKDRFSAYEASSFDEAMFWLESYDPAEDIRADLPLDNTEVPVIELGLKAAAVRMRLSEAKRQYRDLLGEILYALNDA